MMGRPEYVWMFDINRRVYRRDENGKAIGGPIWREHWYKVNIVGETARSWVAANHKKIPKKPAGDEYWFCMSDEDLVRRCYVDQNRHRISDMVLSIRDYDLLSKVASLIGYSPSSIEEVEVPK